MIIGAGPAGSSLAAVLARQGWDVVVLEQRRNLGHKVCGEFISWEARGILGSLGLLQPVEAAGPASLDQAVLSSRSGVPTRIRLRRGSWGLSRRSLDTALAEAAGSAGAKLRLGTRALRFSQDQEGYTVEARQSGRAIELRTQALIAASGRVGSKELPPRPQPALGSLPGGRAEPPHLLRPTSESRPTDPMPARLPPSSAPASQAARTSQSSPSLVGIKCHYQNVQMPAQVELGFVEGGYLGLAPIEGEAVNLCMLASKSALERAGKDPGGLIEDLANRIPRIGRRLAGAEPLFSSPLTAAPIDLWRSPNPWDSIACVGDAAAMIPPLAGDGIAAALRSVELCAPLAHDYLRGEISLEHWELAYRNAWHRSFDVSLAVARRLQRWLGARVVSDLLLGIGWLLPGAAEKLANLTRSR